MCFALSSLMVFQFHKGTIKTVYAEYIYTGDTNFNSIKVQLRRRRRPGTGGTGTISIP